MVRLAPRLFALLAALAAPSADPAAADPAAPALGPAPHLAAILRIASQLDSRQTARLAAACLPPAATAPDRLPDLPDDLVALDAAIDADPALGPSERARMHALVDGLRGMMATGNRLHWIAGMGDVEAARALYLSGTRPAYRQILAAGLERLGGPDAASLARLDR